MGIFRGRPRSARQNTAPAAEAGGQPGLPAFLSAAQSGEGLSPRRRMGLIVRLSIPSILAQVSSILMQYIDAAMVGSLGASASAAIGFMKEYGCTNIKLMVLLAAPEGIERLQKDHPDVDIYCGAVDDHLNEHGYIVPGLGDAGDRIFGTK